MLWLTIASALAGVVVVSAIGLPFKETKIATGAAIVAGPLLLHLVVALLTRRDS
jgi:hypothetical protein